jgi:hypothetical protein
MNLNWLRILAAVLPHNYVALTCGSQKVKVFPQVQSIQYIFAIASQIMILVYHLTSADFIYLKNFFIPPKN